MREFFSQVLRGYWVTFSYVVVDVCVCVWYGGDLGSGGGCDMLCLGVYARGLIM